MPREDYDDHHHDDDDDDDRRSRRRRRDYDDDDDYDDSRYRRRRCYDPHRGTLILVLGILSLVFCGVIGGVIGIAAWIMGSRDLAEIRAGRMDPDGEGMTKAGYVLGIVSVVFMAISIVVIIVFLLSLP